MIYTCDKCRFTFERTGKTEICPDCGGMRVRDADEAETAEYRRNRAEMSNKDIICYCSNVTNGKIVEAIKNGAKTLDDIRKMTKACTVGRCKKLSPRKQCCSPEILKILKEYM